MGIFVGIATALGASSLNIFLKKLSDFTPNFLSWVRFTAASLSLAVLVTVFVGWQMPPLEFWLIVAFIKIPLEIALAWVSTKALHTSDLSLVGPIAAFSSIFLIPVGFVVLGELPTVIGTAGVLLIFTGSFFLGWKKGGKELSYGFAALIGDKGVLLAFLGAFLASLAISTTKFAFQYAHPLLTAFYETAMLSVILSLYLFKQKRVHLRGRAKPLCGLWVTSAVSIALHNIGLSLMPAVYFISIKRLSMVLDVLFGYALFKEERLGERLVGAALMVSGVILIALG